MSGKLVARPRNPPLRLFFSWMGTRLAGVAQFARFRWHAEARAASEGADRVDLVVPLLEPGVAHTAADFPMVRASQRGFVRTANP